MVSSPSFSALDYDGDASDSDSSIDEEWSSNIVYLYPKLTEMWDCHEKPVTLEGILKQRRCVEQMRWALANNASPAKAATGLARFLGDKTTRFRIPKSISCDRLFLREPRDCLYLEAATRYLRGLTVLLPIFEDEVWCYPDVANLEERARARNWAVGAAEVSLLHNRIISPADWASFSLKSFQGRLEFPLSTAEDSMIVPEALFAELPDFMKIARPTPHLAVEVPRIGYYYAYTVSKIRDEAVKKRFEDSFRKEYCVNYMTSYLRDLKEGRIWDIREEYNAFLKDVIQSLPDIPSRKNAQKRSLKYTFLSDFSKIRSLMNPWASCHQFLTHTIPRFEKYEDVYSSKSLAQCGARFFISTTNILSNDSGLTENIIELSNDSLEENVEEPSNHSSRIIKLESISQPRSPQGKSAADNAEDIEQSSCQSILGRESSSCSAHISDRPLLASGKKRAHVGSTKTHGEQRFIETERRTRLRILPSRTCKDPNKNSVTP